MEIENYQKWISEFYKSRGWYALDPFIRMNFLSEETGEVARQSEQLRSVEIGQTNEQPLIKKMMY